MNTSCANQEPWRRPDASGRAAAVARADPGHSTARAVDGCDAALGRVRRLPQSGVADGELGRLRLIGAGAGRVGTDLRLAGRTVMTSSCSGGHFDGGGVALGGLFRQTHGDHLVQARSERYRSSRRALGGGVNMWPLATCSRVLPGNGCWPVRHS